MLDADHGRYSFRFSFNIAGAAANESIPFRDAFLRAETVLSAKSIQRGHQ